MSKKNTPLPIKYSQIAAAYITLFVDKHGYEFTDWVDDDYGIASFIEQYYINYSDIRYDIDNNIEMGLIFQWCDDSLEDHYKPNPQSINFKSYCGGLRFDTEKEL